MRPLFVLLLLVHAIYCHVSLTRDTTKRFTVQFRSATNDTAAVLQDHERFLKYLAQHQVMQDIQIRYNYTNVMNGMSFELKQTGLSAASVKQVNHTVLQFIDYTLSTCPYVSRYWPGKSYPRPKGSQISLFVDVGKPNLHAAHQLTTVDRAKIAGWTGKGVKVAILDTGIDYTHPALGGCFGEGCKVRYGKDLVGDGFNGHNQLILSDDDPMDECDGHGTHIAGIIAANDTEKGFEGVAPNVILGAWRIFGCKGNTDDDVIIAAAEMAVQSGMDIINLSIGGGLGSWQEDPLAVALSNIAKNNITIVVAQGNEGKDGFARTPSPAIGEHLVSVGSVDNTENFGPVVKLIENSTSIGVFEYFLKDSMRFDMETLPLQYMMYACQLNGNGTDKVMIIQYDPACDYSQLIDAAALLVYPNNNNHSIDTILNDKQFNEFNIPVGFMSFEEGTGLAQQISATSLIQFTFMMLKTKTGGRASEFSTWGPDPELHFKPDISAVGGYMYSTYPTNLGAYATISGTSMATPYLSGCLALLMEATGIHDSECLLKRLVNYARPVETIVNNDTVYENPIKQGPGLVQVYDSILGDHSITPSVISLNDSAHFMNSTCISIENNSNKTKLFKLESIPSIGIEGYNFTESAVPLPKPIYHSIHTNVIFDKDTVRVEGGSSQQVCIKFEQPSCAQEHFIYGGFLKLSSADQVSHVPFFGVRGNQKDLPILDTHAGYPFLGDGYGHRLEPQGLSFNFTKSIWQIRNNSVLHIYSRLGNPTSQVKYELLNDTNNEIVGELPIGSNFYLGRNDNSANNYDYVLEWKGELKNSENKERNQVKLMNIHGLDIKNIMTPISTSNVVYAPIGTYKLRISALKIFSDPEDWQTWYSPSFSIIG